MSLVGLLSKLRNDNIYTLPTLWFDLKDRPKNTVALHNQQGGMRAPTRISNV